MAKLQVRFSAAELMLILATMKISSFPPLQASLGKLTEEENKDTLMAARDSLLARGLARIGKEDGFELHPLVLAAVGVAVRPEVGFWLSVVEGDLGPVNVYFNWTRRIIISNWVDRNRVFYFEQIKDKNLIAEEVLRHSRVDPTESEGRGVSYATPASILNQITDGQDKEGKYFAELREAGLTEEDAEDFLQTVIHPRQRSILVAISDMREQPRTAGAVIWITGEKHRWLITEDSERSDITILRPAQGADIFQAISGWVVAVIDNAFEQD